MLSPHRFKDGAAGIGSIDGTLALWPASTSVTVFSSATGGLLEVEGVLAAQALTAWNLS